MLYSLYNSVSREIGQAFSVFMQVHGCLKHLCSAVITAANTKVQHLLEEQEMLTSIPYPQ